MSVWELRLDQFRDQTASAAPTPGGGSVACVSAALGCGLLVMAGEITRKRNPSPERDELVGRARAIMDELSQLADADTRVFGNFMTAWKMPRSSDGEKAVRTQAIAAAALEACAVPLSAGENIERALTLAKTGAPLIKPEVLSDVYAAIDLLRGALGAVLHTIDINVPYLGSDEQKREIEARRDRLRAIV